jgi:hypothetical protein
MLREVLVIVFLVMLMVGMGHADLVYTLASPNPVADGNFGQSVCGAEVTGDERADLIVGAPNEYFTEDGAGRAYVFSGSTGNYHHPLQSPDPVEEGHFGCSVSLAGDWNNDGNPDVIVGASRDGVGAIGKAHIFKGNTGTWLRTLQSTNPVLEGGFGASVSGAGDVNNDNLADVIVGAPTEHGGSLGSGRAYIFLGDDGSSLYELVSPNPETGGGFGGSVSGAGDVNSDGYDDVVIGASWEDGGAVNAGRVYIFSGNGGGLLYTLECPQPEVTGRFGVSVSGAGDVNDDSYADVIVGALLEIGGVGDAGKAYVFSGNGGGLLYSLESPNAEAGGYFGFSVSGAGDLNSDGHTEVIVGAPLEDSGATDAGRAYLFSGDGGGLYATLETPNPISFGQFGGSVSAAGYVDLSIVPDVIVGAAEEHTVTFDTGRAYVFDPPFRLSLTSDLVAGELQLEWTPCPGVFEYWIYGADNQPYFEPGLFPPYQYHLDAVPSNVTTWSSSAGIADPEHNWTYMVVAVLYSEEEIGRSNGVGEHDFNIVIAP